MTVLGIDFSTRQVDCVLLSEDDNSARWIPVPFVDHKPPFRFDDARNIRQAFLERVVRQWPRKAWQWDEVSLVGIEKPYAQGRGTAYTYGLVTGAILSVIPRGIPVLDMPPSDRLFGWKALSVGKTNATKAEVAAWALNVDDRGRCSGCGNAPDRIRLCCDACTEAVQRLDWPQDAFDALAIAHAARRLNEQAVDAA